jgi:ribonuclease HI
LSHGSGHQSLRQADPERDMEPASDTPVHDDQYVLFFDGGSRGNPGPGGSGAVIIKTNQRATQASIIWSAAMSAAQATTTNNQAEYAGAVTGLCAARDNDWAPLEIVGDSQFILRQLRDYKPPNNTILRDAYAVARRLADALGVRRWNHHLRVFNRMADAAANAAMDTRSSSQVLHPTTRDRHAQLGQHLATDFAHWQANFFIRMMS